MISSVGSDEYKQTRPERYRNGMVWCVYFQSVIKIIFSRRELSKNIFRLTFMEQKKIACEFFDKQL